MFPPLPGVARCPLTDGAPEADILREQHSDLVLEVHWDRSEALVIVGGVLDGVAGIELAERLIELSEVLGVLNGEPQRLVVDLADVSSANQAAARALEEARQQISPKCSLVLRAPSRAASKVLAPAGLLDDEAAAGGQAAGGRRKARR